MPIQQGMMQGPPQGVPQGPPQGQPQGAVSPETANVYPASKEQAEKFIYSTVQVIHEDEQVPQILKEAKGTDAPVGMIIGALAGQILTQMYTQLFQQTDGQVQVDKQFAVKTIRLAIQEISAMAEAAKIPVAKEDKQQAAKVAGDAIETAMEDIAGGQEAPPGPQGPQGAMQGPPQVAQGGV